MSWRISRAALSCAAALAALALAGCDKGTDLGVDLPQAGAISTQYVDVPLSVATVRADSADTQKTDHYLVGRFTDAVSGQTEARALLNVAAVPGRTANSVTDSLPSHVTNPLLDSLVVYAAFDQVYGSAQGGIRLDAYELGAKLDDRRAYNSSTAVALGSVIAQNVFASLTRTKQIKQLLTGRTDSVAVTLPDPTVRLNLGTSSALAPRLFTALKAGSFTQTQLDAAWLGLALVPSANQNTALVAFGRSSRVAVYYHAAGVKTSKGVNKSHRYDLFFGPSAGTGGVSANDPRYFTQITTNPAGAQLSALTNSSAAVTAAALGGTSYLQEGVDLGTRITFDAGLAALLNKPGLAINRAELYIPVKPYSNALYANPAGIYAKEVDGNNQALLHLAALIPAARLVQADGTLQKGIGADAIGPLVNGASPAPYYSLLVTSYLQAYLSNSLDGPQPAALLLLPTEIGASTNGALGRNRNALLLNRAVLDASNVRLRVYYSQLRS